MTIDDDELTALLRTAATAEDAPPSAFDHADVLAGSARIGRRRATLAAAAVAVALAGGIGTVVVPQLRGTDQQTSAAAPARAPESGQAGPSGTVPPSGALLPPGVALGSRTPEAGAPAPAALPNADSEAPAAAPGSAPVVPGSAAGAPPASGPPPAASGAAPRAAAPGSASESSSADAPGPAGVAPERAPSARSQSACGSSQDAQLRTLLDDALPAVAGAPAAPTTQECRPAGERSVSVEATDGDRSGVLGVVLVPEGGKTPSFGSGATVKTARASSGTVYVGSRASSGEAPFADQLAAVASRIAANL